MSAGIYPYACIHLVSLYHSITSITPQQWGRSHLGQQNKHSCFKVLVLINTAPRTHSKGAAGASSVGGLTLHVPDQHRNNSYEPFGMSYLTWSKSPHSAPNYKPTTLRQRHLTCTTRTLFDLHASAIAGLGAAQAMLSNRANCCIAPAAAPRMPPTIISFHSSAWNAGLRMPIKSGAGIACMPDGALVKTKAAYSWCACNMVHAMNGRFFCW